MKAVKYQAWIKGLEKMVVVTRIDWNSTWPHIAYEGDDAVVRQVDIIDVELRQYTGLKDKNGVEIYEGDICHTIYHITHGPHEDYNSEVFWGEDNAGYLFDRQGEWTMVELSSVEVIGNIYENKELLND